MEVSQYTFKSPYPNPVQFGQKDTTAEQNSASNQEASKLTQQADTTQQAAAQLTSEQTQDVTPNVSQTRLLDVYA